MTTTVRNPHEHSVWSIHPTSEWAEASCSREAHVLDGLDNYDGPLLAEELSDRVEHERLRYELESPA